MGLLYYKLRLPESAIVQLKECVRRAPGNSVYQYHLGMAYMAAGRPESAERLLNQALRSNRDFPHEESARAALEKISKGGLRF